MLLLRLFIRNMKECGRLHIHRPCIYTTHTLCLRKNDTFEIIPWDSESVLELSLLIYLINKFPLLIE